jgi:hypothetical protein
MSQLEVEHYLIIDTSQYAGNFERELVGFVFGVYDEYGDHQAMPWIESQTEEERKDVELFAGGEKEGILDMFPRHDYGMVWVDIEGAGWPCNYVRVKIMSECWDEVTQEVLDKLVERCKRFCELYNSIPGIMSRLPSEDHQIEFMGLRHQTREIRTTIEKL